MAVGRHLEMDAIADVTEQTETRNTFQLIEDNFWREILSGEQYERHVDDARESENDVDERQRLKNAIQLIDGLTDKSVMRTDFG